MYYIPYVLIFETVSLDKLQEALSTIFTGILAESPLTAKYPHWVLVDQGNFPPCFLVSLLTRDNYIIAGCRLSTNSC
jgi:hypothetical protein